MIGTTVPAMSRPLHCGLTRPGRVLAVEAQHHQIHGSQLFTNVGRVETIFWEAGSSP